jgi:hypothetical protein
MSKGLRVSLVVLLVFLGLTAVAGGFLLLTGGGAPGVELLRGSPFSDYTVPGLALLVIVGGGGLAAAFLVARHHALGLPAAGVAGFGMVCFEIVEILVLRYQTTGALIWQLFGIALGLVIMVLAAALWRLDRGKPSAG